MKKLTHKLSQQILNKKTITFHKSCNFVNELQCSNDENVKVTTIVEKDIQHPQTHTHTPDLCVYLWLCM